MSARKSTQLLPLNFNTEMNVVDDISWPLTNTDCAWIIQGSFAHGCVKNNLHLSVQSTNRLSIFRYSTNHCSIYTSWNSKNCPRTTNNLYFVGKQVYIHLCSMVQKYKALSPKVWRYRYDRTDGKVILQLDAILDLFDNSYISRFPHKTLHMTYNYL